MSSNALFRKLWFGALAVYCFSNIAEVSAVETCAIDDQCYVDGASYASECSSENSDVCSTEKKVQMSSDAALTEEIEYYCDDVCEGYESCSVDCKYDEDDNEVTITFTCSTQPCSSSAVLLLLFLFLLIIPIGCCVAILCQKRAKGLGADAEPIISSDSGTYGTKYEASNEI